jgi:hypothetical protein
MLNPDDIFNDPTYEYGEPGEFSKNLPITKNDIKQAQEYIESDSLITTKSIVNDILGNDCLNDIIEGKNKEESINTDKHWLIKKGEVRNPFGRPKREKKTLSAVIEMKLNGEKLDPDHNEMHKFVERLFELYHDQDKNPMTAGIEILNRYEGKVKDVIQVGPITEHIPNQEEQLKIANSFKVGTVAKVLTQ